MTTIRNYEPSDLEACRSLWVVLTEEHRKIYDAPSIGGDHPGLQFDDHLQRVGPENLWVAEVDGRVVGLSGLILEEGEAELEPVVVLPTYRGRSLGRQLVDVARFGAIAAGVRTFKVRPVARNAEAIRFYHRMGFSVLGYIEMFEDLREQSPAMWVEGETVAGMDFLV